MRALDIMRAGDYPRAARLFRRHLQMPEAVWQDERCLSMLCLAGCACATHDDAQAERWILRACAESPESAQPWDCAADFYRRVGKTETAALCCARADALSAAVSAQHIFV